jgi:hypothetical protein
MRWRYLNFGVPVSFVVAAIIHLWPKIPAYRIPGSNERQFLGEDRPSGQLLFLYFGPNEDQPPVIERRDAESGKLVATLPLEWDAMTSWSRESCYGELSDNCRTVFLTLSATGSAPSTEKFVGTFFDATTGRQGGATFAFDHRGTSGLSPDGRWLWSTQLNPNCRLVIRDTQTGKSHFELPSPTGRREIIRFCFDADSQNGVFQWLTDPKKLTEESRTLHLLNLDSRQIEQSYLLPERQELRDWRRGELWIQVWNYSAPVVADIHQFRHKLDGRILTLGERDPLLDRFYDGQRFLQSVCDETEDGVTQFVEFLPEEPEWSRQIDKVERFIGRKLFDRGDMRLNRGWVRLVDRETKQVRFEQKVPHPFDCRFVLGGKLMLMPGERSSPATEVYRIDAWPRWVWTALAMSSLLVVFSIVSRRRQVVIQRKRQATGSTSL